MAIKFSTFCEFHRRLAISGLDARNLIWTLYARFDHEMLYAKVQITLASRKIWQSGKLSGNFHYIF
jgi:hypothetical protein